MLVFSFLVTNCRLKRTSMFRFAASTLLFFLLSSGLLPAQSAAYARLHQDVQLLSEQLGKLRLRVDVLERENAQLQTSLDAQIRANRELSAALESYSASIDGRLAALDDRDRKLKAEVIRQVNGQIEALATEFQKAIDALAEAQSIQPNITQTVTFDEDYPQDGVPYEVQPGDTLSGIARRYNSTIRDIQNANRIANPNKDLRVGDIIFVPQQNSQ